MNLELKANQDALDVIARMAYGSRITERTNGGNGNIGIIRTSGDSDFGAGKLRVIKYNTHRSDRNDADNVVTQAQIAAANNLRGQLLQIARTYGVTQDTMSRIREELDLPAENAGDTIDIPLERRTVAKVVKMIDGGVWDRALSGVDIKSYSSADVDTTFDTVKRLEGNLIAGQTNIADTKMLAALSEGARAARADDRPELGAIAQEKFDAFVEMILKGIAEALLKRQFDPTDVTPEKGANAVRNAFALALIACDDDPQSRQALAYINRISGKSYANLKETPFAAAAKGIRWVRNSFTEETTEVRQRLLGRALVELAKPTRISTTVLNGFGTVDQFEVTAEATLMRGALAERDALRLANLDEQEI